MLANIKLFLLDLNNEGGERMKKSLLIMLILICCILTGINQTQAKSWGYKYKNSGYLFSNATMPHDVAKAINFTEDNIVPVSNESKEGIVKYETLKKGTSSRINILKLVEIGDAGILKAAKEGEIKKIHYIEVKRQKVYAPTPWLPIYFNRFITNVYGE